MGTEGTIASWDYADHVTVQTRARPEPHPIPADPLPEGRRNAIEYVLGCIARGEALTGPLDPAVSLIGQRIVDTAAQSRPAKSARCRSSPDAARAAHGAGGWMAEALKRRALIVAGLGAVAGRLCRALAQASGPNGLCSLTLLACPRSGGLRRARRFRPGLRPRLR